jgi:hypothetical protein
MLSLGLAIAALLIASPAAAGQPPDDPDADAPATEQPAPQRPGDEAADPAQDEPAAGPPAGVDSVAEDPPGDRGGQPARYAPQASEALDAWHECARRMAFALHQERVDRAMAESAAESCASEASDLRNAVGSDALFESLRQGVIREVMQAYAPARLVHRADPPMPQDPFSVALRAWDGCGRRTAFALRYELRREHIDRDMAEMALGRCSREAAALRATLSSDALFEHMRQSEIGAVSRGGP